ncbi:condensation domain-containing protein [Massilia sp. MB5]|uniref:condensation domain-containing protein n=1 Tax=Massilia sp. MB5 TaxID=2919578 RepID=UPI0021A7FD11|nr:condensation domain-containing protein [Massilia sp. MB5]
MNKPADRFNAAEMGALSPYQQRLVFLDQFNGGSAHCNRLRAFELEGCFNPAMAEQALSALAGRHHLLRARFVADEGGAAALGRSRRTAATLSRSECRRAAANGAA